MEGRLLLEGTEHIFGIKTDLVPGNSIREKKAFLYTMSSEFLNDALSSSQAFFYILLPGIMFTIPSDYMVCVASATNTKGVRWSLSADDNDSARVKKVLTAVLASFPELRGMDKGYQQFCDFLQD